MPFIRVDIASKLSKEQKALLAEKITEAVGSVTQAPAQVTYVIINKTGTLRIFRGWRGSC